MTASRRRLAIALAIAAGALIATASAAIGQRASQGAQRSKLCPTAGCTPKKVSTKPIKGATYVGTTVHGKSAITLTVSRSGRSVMVSVPFAPLYCEGGGAGERQITKPAAITKGGTFKGSIAYEFTPTKKKTAKLYFTGKFAGASVSGTARSEFLLVKGCNGSTKYTARTK